MSDNNPPESDTAPRIDELLAPYLAKYHRKDCYPGLIFQQGKRKMVQINIPANDLPTLLQAKPSTGNDPDSGKNRPEIKGHAEDIKQYILKRARDELKDYDVAEASEILARCLNTFFSECSQTRHICEISVEELTIEDVNKFTDSCILGRSVGLEILGRLLYCTYDRDSSQDFETERVLQLAQLDWSRKSHLWEGNVVLYNSTPTNNKSYKISSNASSVKVAVSKVKAHLEWI